MIANQSTIDPATKQRFREVVAQNRKPGASSGRPVVAQDSQAAADPRRR